MTDSPASDSAERKEMPLPSDLKAMMLVGIFSLLLLYALYLTAEIVVPVIIAFLLKMVLEPATEMLVDLHLPRFLAAFVVVCAVLGILSGLALLLSGPATVWVSRAPETFAKLEKRLEHLSAMARNLQKASHDVEKIAEDASAPAVAVKGTAAQQLPVQRYASPSSLASSPSWYCCFFSWFPEIRFSAALSRFCRRCATRSRPSTSSTKSANDVGLSRHGDDDECRGRHPHRNRSLFLRVERSLLWGSVAFLLNFVPILGPVVGMILLALVGLANFDTVWQALLPAGIYLLIHLAEGEVITPVLLARQFTLNPVVVIVSLVFWYWMWGVAGALLAVPMVATFKIICDRIDGLKAIGHFLGTEARDMQPAVP
jgi:predicted PurR-regulated permease PerM